MKTTKVNDLVPTVFLHGFSGDSDGLRPFADAYASSAPICVDLPGFGGTPASPGSESYAIKKYCEDVWREIRKQVPAGKINLVGHSHGAMVGYVLAVLHPDDVVRLDLFCPVARPRLLPRLGIGFLHALRRLGVPPLVIIKFVAHPLLVSLVTRYSFQPGWSREIRQQITRMRRREARNYSPIMFDLMEQTVRFADEMDNSQCSVPTRLCYVTDENVASDDDFDWYRRRTNTVKIRGITGGHLCVVADPTRVVKLFGTEEVA